MKTILITFTLITMNLTPHSLISRKEHLKMTPAPETAALRIIAALQQSSSEVYMTMFPSLTELHHLMDDNSRFYGENLTAAKLEFADEYENSVVPQVEHAFENLLEEGKQKHINWATIRFSHVVVHEEAQDLQTVPFCIVFFSGNKQYTLCIEKAFVAGGQWKVSQYLKLV